MFNYQFTYQCNLIKKKEKWQNADDGLAGERLNLTVVN